ncbi:MAG: hypothetical protein H6736_24800 [Alphaproteobacteria bacterium]|nr:hypothetical protein [Alphaproteobacteria bacterium]
MLLFNVALALDCADTTTYPDADLCEAVSTGTDDVNSLYGSTVVHDGAKARLRPSTWYDRLSELRDLANANGCTTTPTFDGLNVAAFGASTWTGTWRHLDSTSGSHAGTIDRNTIEGSFSGDDSGGIGEVYGHARANRRVIADREDGFVVGHWQRVAGSNGVFFGLEATCDGAATAPEAFNDWLGNDLLLCVSLPDVDEDGTCGPRVWYVDDDAAGVADGTSWDDAYPTLQAAVDAAASGDVVWVAEGRYASTAAGEAGRVMTMAAGVDVYGGFRGNETLLRSRAGRFAKTVIDGDVLGDDVYGDISTRTDNGLRLVFGADDTVLDGFTLRGGYSEETDDLGYGSAMKVGGPMEMTLRNLRFVDNLTDRYATLEVFGAAHLEDVLFLDNQARQGAAVRFVGAGSTMRDCVVTSNDVIGGTRAGVVYATSSVGSVEVVDTTFYANTTEDDTAGNGNPVFANGTASVSLRNVAWYEDLPPRVADGTSATITVDDSCVSFDPSGWGSGNTWLDDSTSELSDPFVGVGDDLFLRHTATGDAFTSACVDAGSTAWTDGTWMERTTRTDGVLDTGAVDAGAHYP